MANLIKKIRPIEFRERYLLNYSLLDFMLESEAYEEQLGHLMSQLHNDNDYGTSFIDGFLDNGVNIPIFIKRLLNVWPRLWKFVDELSDYTKERKEEYFIALIKYSNVNDLLIASKFSNFKRKVAERQDFLTIVDDSHQLKTIIEKLEIEFTDIYLTGAPQLLIDLVIKGAHYALNDRMLRRVMQTSTKFDLPAYEESNYSAILDSHIPELISNINNKLTFYIADIYLPLSGNVREPEKQLLELLNSETITLENRVEIINRSQTLIGKLSDVTNKELDESILNSKKLVVSWDNMIEHFNRHDGIDEALVNYLNDPEIAGKLSVNDIDIEQPYIDLETTENFMHHLVCEGRLTDLNFALLTKAVTYNYDMEEISGISREKLSTLIDRTQIAPKPENFKELKSLYPGLHHNFLDIFVPDVMSDLANYVIDGSDITHIMKSASFELPDKLIVIEAVGDEIIKRSATALMEIRALMFAYHPLPIRKNIIIAVLNLYGPLNQRIQLFNMYYRTFEGSDAQAVFGNFPAPFNKIGVRHTSFMIDDEIEFQYLANNLQEIGMIVNHKPDKKGIKIINFKWN